MSGRHTSSWGYDMAQILLVARAGATVGLRRHLTSAGLGVHLVEQLPASEAAALIDAYDVLILDCSSVEDELEVVRVVRDSGNLVPIVLVSGEAANEDRARGLDAGADSYFAGPFSPLVLVAQVRAHVRRSMRRRCVSAGVAHSGRPGLWINVEDRSISDDEKRVSLAPRESSLLRALAYRQGRYVSTEHLLRMVWGEEFSNVQVVAACVRQVRVRLSEFGSPHLIESRRGFGYRLSNQANVVNGVPNLPAARRPLHDAASRASDSHAT